MQLWCTELTLIRYLRARSWDVNKASLMLQKTLDWWVRVEAFLCPAASQQVKKSSERTEAHQIVVH